MSMLYKAPGPHFCDGHMVDYIVVPMDEDEATVAKGWFRTIPEALEAAKGVRDSVVTPEKEVAATEPEAPKETEVPKRRGRPPKAANVDKA